MKQIIALLSLVLLSACATKPIATNLAKEVSGEKLLSTEFTTQKENTGTVVVKRDSGFFGSACSSRIYANSTPIADISPKEKITIYLPEGNHTRIQFASATGGLIPKNT